LRIKVRVGAGSSGDKEGRFNLRKTVTTTKLLWEVLLVPLYPYFLWRSISFLFFMTSFDRVFASLSIQHHCPLLFISLVLRLFLMIIWTWCFRQTHESKVRVKAKVKARKLIQNQEMHPQRTTRSWDDKRSLTNQRRRESIIKHFLSIFIATIMLECKVKSWRRCKAPDWESTTTKKCVKPFTLELECISKGIQGRPFLSK